MLNDFDVANFCEAQEQACYLYDVDEILKRLDIFKKHLPQNQSIHYAMKANSNSVILKSIAELGYGADVVSGGELTLALNCGFKAENIVFSGVGKTHKEIELALNSKIKQINVESPQELQRISDIAKKLGTVASVALRMNPDVDPDTHPYIKTGFRDNKFGMDASFLPELKSLLLNNDHLHLCGLTIHIGSQIVDLNSFKDAIDKTKHVYNELKHAGFEMTTFDVGGGLGMSYEKQNYESDYERIQNYCEVVKEALSDLDLEVLVEPGRILTARAGVLLSQVEYIKSSPYKNFAIVNTGMHHLMRPCLYQAHHEIKPVSYTNKKPMLYDIVGPICESSDVIGYDRLLPELDQGEWLSIFDTGAYGYAMANTYNCHELPLEFCYKNSELITSH